jgi:hypothetical protein
MKAGLTCQKLEKQGWWNDSPCHETWGQVGVGRKAALPMNRKSALTPALSPRRGGNAPNVLAKSGVRSVGFFAEALSAALRCEDRQ